MCIYIYISNPNWLRITQISLVFITDQVTRIIYMTIKFLYEEYELGPEL